MEDDHVQGGVVLQVHRDRPGGRGNSADAVGSELGLTGRVLVAEEGIMAQSHLLPPVPAWTKTLRAWTSTYL